MDYELYREGGDPDGNYLDLEYTLTTARSTAYDLILKSLMDAKRKGISPAKVKGIDIYKVPSQDAFLLIFEPYGTVRPDPRNPSKILWIRNRKAYVLNRDGTLRK